MLSTEGYPDPVTGQIKPWVDPYTGQNIDPEFLAAMINRQVGPVTSKGRVRAVDWGFNPVDVGLGGDDPSNVSRFIIRGTETISCDTSQAVHRSMSFQMHDPLFFPGVRKDLQFNSYHHYLQPTMVLSCQGKTAEIPMGTYWAGDWIATITSLGKRVYTFACRDITVRASTDMVSDWTVPTTTTYIDGAVALITSDGVCKSLGGKGQTPQGNDDCGPGFTQAMLDIDWTGNQPVTVPVPFRFASNRLANLGDLMNAIQYWPPHMSNLSKVNLHRMPDFINTLPAVSWDYSVNTPGKPKSIVFLPIQSTYESASRICNYLRLQGGQPTASGGSTLTTTRVNSDPNSQVSYPNIKAFNGNPLAIPRAITDNTLTTQALVNLAADNAIAEGDTLRESVATVSYPNPLHEVHEFVIFNVCMNDGTVAIFSDEQHMFQELGWSITNFLSPNARMQHDWVRAEAL
jgi:hypothetical protein